jgi:hypothetical protein
MGALVPALLLGLAPFSQILHGTPPTVLEKLRANANLTNFSQLVNAANLPSIFDDPNTLVTLFAPTNDAFAKLNSSTWKRIQADKRQACLQHAAFGDILTTALKPTQDIETLAGDTVTITRVAASIHFGPALVTTPDIIASNGVMDIIDAVLLPTPSPPAPSPGPAHPTPKLPTPRQPTPSVASKYDCEFNPPSDYQCKPSDSGAFNSSAACKLKCRLPSPTPAPPTPAPGPVCCTKRCPNGCTSDCCVGMSGEGCSWTPDCDCSC